ncbi:hypothetical protein V1279_000856 [Bradyrhizobium sp. AZCC 1610]
MMCSAEFLSNHRSCSTGDVLFFSTACHHLHNLVRQRSLQRLRFFPWPHASKHRVLQVVRKTGIALVWIASTVAFGAVVRKPYIRCSGIGLDFVPWSPLYSVQIPAKAASGRSSSSPNQTMAGEKARIAGHFPDLAKHTLGSVEDRKVDVGADVEDADFERRVFGGISEEGNASEKWPPQLAASLVGDGPYPYPDNKGGPY